MPKPGPGENRSGPLAAVVNRLHREILACMESGGEAFVSNAVIDGTFAWRACIVNFRTNTSHIEALPRLVLALGKALDAELRPPNAP